MIQPNKPEITLSNPPPLTNQQSVGVIVKHDTSLKLNPIQLTHPNVEKVYILSLSLSLAISVNHSEYHRFFILRFRLIPR